MQPTANTTYTHNLEAHLVTNGRSFLYMIFGDYQLQNSFVTRVCPQIVGVSYVGEQFRILCLIYTMHGIGIQ